MSSDNCKRIYDDYIEISVSKTAPNAALVDGIKMRQWIDSVTDAFWVELSKDVRCDTKAEARITIPHVRVYDEDDPTNKPPKHLWVLQILIWTSWFLGVLCSLLYEPVIWLGMTPLFAVMSWITHKLSRLTPGPPPTIEKYTHVMRVVETENGEWRFVVTND